MHTPRFAAFVGLWLASVAGLGCITEVVPDPGAEAGPAKEVEDAVIVGGVNWQGVQNLEEGSAERENSRAVGYLSIPAQQSRCTAFLITPDVVMTNRHCIPQASAASGASVSFGYEAGSSDYATYACSTFLGGDAELDFALLQCEGRPGDDRGVVELDPAEEEDGHALYVIHQNCDYFSNASCAPTKKYSPGKVLDWGFEVSHDADTLGGSSGSPVFSKTTHAVFALHHAGVATGSNGRGTKNYAVPMSRILPVLHDRFPSLDLGPRAPAGSSQDDGASAGDGATQSQGLEPNDAFADAIAVSAPTSLTGLEIASSTDEDWFAFDGGAAGSVGIRFSHQVGDLDLYLYDGAGREIGRSIGVTDEESIAVPAGAGAVRVRVVGYRGATGAYTLEVQ